MGTICKRAMVRDLLRYDDENDDMNLLLQIKYDDSQGDDEAKVVFREWKEEYAAMCRAKQGYAMRRQKMNEFVFQFWRTC